MHTYFHDSAHSQEKHGASIFYKWGQLIRIDKPAGTMLLAIPCLWGSAMAVTHAIIAEGADIVALQAPFVPIHLFGLFFFGAWTMRSAGCIINDMWDRDLDKNVERTKSRPLAAGTLTMQQATVMLGVHLMLGSFVALSIHPVAVVAAFASVPLMVLYPLMKRVTFMPQVFLGMTFNWGVFVGYAAVLGRVDPLVCIPLWVSGICWTVIYDTIYAYQDRTDDIKTGIKSTAILFGDSKRPLYYLCVPLLGGLLASGVAVGQSFPYYFAVTTFMLHLTNIIDHFNMNDPWSCMNAFKRNVRFGLYVLVSMFLGNLVWAIYSVMEGVTPKPDSAANTATAALSKALRMNVTPVDQPRADRLSFSWIDRLVKPAFVHTHVQATKYGIQNADIPAYMRREYFAQNVATVAKASGLVPPEMVDEWEAAWYNWSDHYNVFGSVF